VRGVSDNLGNLLFRMVAIKKIFAECEIKRLKVPIKCVSLMIQACCLTRRITMNATELNTYRVEYPAKGGDWGSVQIEAATPAEAVARVADSDLPSSAGRKMVRASHQIIDNKPVRI